ncbi:MAG: TonB C-terminal domain-containing protein [Gemmatimonadales bacterium]
MRALADRAAAERPAPMALLMTAALHGLLIAAFVLPAREVRNSPLPAYSVELIAAPRASTDAATTDAAAAPTPTPAPPTRAEARGRPTARPEGRQPTAAPVPSARPPVRPSAVPATAAAPSPNTNTAPGTGTAPATIRTVGVEFPFEGYLRNLVAQVYRRWHPPAGNADLESEMLFFVHRDGSITGLQFVTRSGSFAFDLEAQGAVEAASRAGSFGPLPAGFAPDVLPVSFFFSPRSLR